jgi:hypothetical protein
MEKAADEISANSGRALVRRVDVRDEKQIAKSEHLIKVAEEWLALTDTERRVYVAPSRADARV